MSATAAVNPVVPPAPASSRPAAAAPATDDNRFDRHLDAARQPQNEAADTASRDGRQGQPAAKAPAASAAERRADTEATATKPGDADAAALAAAMLALIGQAAPANVPVPASPVTHAAGKPVAAVQAAVAPAALLLQAGAAAVTANAAAAQPVLVPDARTLAPLLAKPAEQKDAPLEAAQLATLAAAPQPATDAGATLAPGHALSISSPAGTPAFAQELGQHVAWLGTQEVKQARIRLHPEDLGTLDVKVSLNHDRVDVSFAVQHPAAVHAVQQTLPQLDALLAHHGLALGQADVGQRQQHGEGGRGGEAASATGEVDADPGATASAPVASLGMLDTFA